MTPPAPEPGPAAPSDAVLRRWRAVLAADARLDAAAGRLLVKWGRTVDAARTVPLGLALAGPEPELAVIAVAFTRDPELADRLAAEYVHRVAAVSVRAPVVAAQFLALGDPARALAWMDRAVAESPRHPDHLHALGRMAVAAGDPVRAQVHFIEAAARSGDAGRDDLAAAALLIRAGYPVEALTAARRALGETAPGAEGPVLDVVAAAATAAGRTADAERACADRLARLPERFRADAPGRLQPPVDEPPAADEAEAAAELLLIGMSSAPEPAAAALEAFAAAADRLGAAPLARAARAEARGLVAITPARVRGCARRTPEP